MVAKMTVVMQQRRRHDHRRLIGLKRKGCTLQGMLQLRHVFAVLTMAVIAIRFHHIIEAGRVHGGNRWSVMGKRKKRSVTNA